MKGNNSSLCNCITDPLNESKRHRASIFSVVSWNNIRNWLMMRMTHNLLHFCFSFLCTTHSCHSVHTGWWIQYTQQIRKSTTTYPFSTLSLCSHNVLSQLLKEERLLEIKPSHLPERTEPHHSPPGHSGRYNETSRLYGFVVSPEYSLLHVIKLVDDVDREWFPHEAHPDSVLQTMHHMLCSNSFPTTYHTFIIHLHCHSPELMHSNNPPKEHSLHSPHLLHRILFGYLFINLSLLLP